jgi:hypothetical protein
MKIILTTAGIAVFAAGTAQAGPVIGLVDFDGTELGLIGYSNPVVTYIGPGFGTDATQLDFGLGFATTLWGGGDALWPMIRANIGPNNFGMPFSISDDSVVAAAGNSVFPTDTLGFAGQALDNNGFFGITDTENPNNSGTITVDFQFDITGAAGLGVSIDFTAMGDFEATGTVDIMDFTYSIDGSPFAPLFTSSVDDTIAQVYNMDNPANNPVNLNDPMLIDGVLLDDNYQTFTKGLAGSGSVLTLRLTAQTDGSEGMGFDNITVFVPSPGALALLGLAGLTGTRRRRRG